LRSFKLDSEMEPRGDQPEAIRELVGGLSEGHRYQTLLGVTGSGKTYTLAKVIEAVQRPTLVISPNKTLAAQLCSEFKAFFPDNAVGYFVSYYDYYQPEAYVPTTDTYVEKDASINEEIDRLRHATTRALLSRRDVIIVASVSCIYNLGSPEDYRKTTFEVSLGDSVSRREILRRLVDMQYERNDVALSKGRFRARGNILDVCPPDEEFVLRIELLDDEIRRLSLLDTVTGRRKEEVEGMVLFPARHFVTMPYDLERALREIRREMEENVAELRRQRKFLEAQRLQQRTRFDMEMIRNVGYCNGIENYSRHFDGRKPGEPPHCLLDFFPRDFLTVIDESHITVPQLRGMYLGDESRKRTLVEYGFRLPSALDNRPLTYEEFDSRVNQVIFSSATPGRYEYDVSSRIVEQIIRPTGLVDPEVLVKPASNQVDDLIEEVRRRTSRGERVLVTTLTKRTAEGLAEYLAEMGLRVRYLHSDIDTLKRVEILRDLRLGKFDVLVGINLLREGLDLPEVSLVAILDADNEGFLRSETSLVQTMGRAARNVSGQVILYADNLTDSMGRAIRETDRRRKIQLAYNQEHDITPETVRKEIRSLIAASAQGEAVEVEAEPGEDAEDLFLRLEGEMLAAADRLEFEKAAELRDRLKKLRGAIVQRGQ
jgi:excinuclease ABC subunit B